MICFRGLVERLIWLQISSVSSAAMLQCCNVRISLGVKLAAMQKYDCVSNQLQHENITMCNFSCKARMSLCVKLTTTQKCHCVSNQQQHENITVCLMFWCWWAGVDVGGSRVSSQSQCVKLSATQKCHCVSNHLQHKNITVFLMFWWWWAGVDVGGSRVSSLHSFHPCKYLILQISDHFISKLTCQRH